LLAALPGLRHRAVPAADEVHEFVAEADELEAAGQDAV
jgi:hypothetical protein